MATPEAVERILQRAREWYREPGSRFDFKTAGERQRQFHEAKTLYKEMMNAADEEDFESAARIKVRVVRLFDALEMAMESSDGSNGHGHASGSNGMRGEEAEAAVAPTAADGVLVAVKDNGIRDEEAEEAVADGVMAIVEDDIAVDEETREDEIDNIDETGLGDGGGDDGGDERRGFKRAMPHAANSSDDEEDPAPKRARTSAAGSSMDFVDPDRHHKKEEGRSKRSQKNELMGHFLLHLESSTAHSIPTRDYHTQNPQKSLSKLKAVLAALSGGGGCVAAEPHAVELLDALQRLAQPHGNPPRHLIIVDWQPSLPWSLAEGTKMKVRLDVWLCPKLFDIRSDYDLYTLMHHMKPTQPVIPMPVPPTAFQPSAQAGDSEYQFSLAGLMKAVECTGYAEAAQPLGLATPLYSYQKQSLRWMLDQEKRPGGLNELFWEEHPLGSGDAFFYNPTACEFMGRGKSVAGDRKLMDAPLHSGGFLCEEMGLGKTLEVIALILSNGFDERLANTRIADWRQHGKLPYWSCHPMPATLVIVPRALLSQWLIQFEQHVHLGQLSVTTWAAAKPYNAREREIKQTFPAGGSAASIKLKLTGNAKEAQKVIVTSVEPSYARQLRRSVDQSDCVCVDDAVLQVFHGKVLKWSQEKQVRKRKGRATENVNAVLDELRRLLFDQTATVTVVCRRKLPSLSLVAKDHDVVLTTYETLENTDMIENRVFWWRVVLDESQMAKSPKHAITKRGSVLPRVHSWLVSGTPMPTLVDDLLGQLTFLGVEPFCRTGADVDDWCDAQHSPRPSPSSLTAPAHTAQVEA